jgi:hypothetical protein
MMAPIIKKNNKTLNTKNPKKNKAAPASIPISIGLKIERIMFLNFINDCIQWKTCSRKNYFKFFGIKKPQLKTAVCKCF